MRMVRRSKRLKERNVKDPFKKLPNDMIVEILMKLRPRTIARLRFASKQLSSIILDKEFTKLYMTRSSTKPRHLVSLQGYRDMQMQGFHSFSQEHPPSNHYQVSYKLDPDLSYVFAPPVRGLICGRNGTKMVVGNPWTGQFVSLPRVRTRRKEILSIFGYDVVNDVYKVLCMTVISKRSNMSRRGEFVAWEDIMSEEHQVITLGTKEKWRMVECKYPHRHDSGGCLGICRDGVLYYLAFYNKKRTLMSFDLSSQEFNVTKVPEDDNVQQFGNLMNHTGKITIVSQGFSGTTDLWVLEDANKEEWSKTAVLVPSMFTDIAGRFHAIMLRGILGNGKMIFAPLQSLKPFFFVCYDPKDKTFTQIVMNGIGDDSDNIQVFFDQVESCMIL